MKTRHISEQFLEELKTGHFEPIVSIVRVDPTLDLELRGTSVVIYYRGGKILTISEPRNSLTCTSDAEKHLKVLDSKYLNGKSIIEPTLDKMDLYFAKAKHFIDVFEATGKSKLEEKEIQQRVVAENNYSVNSDQSDFFIADMEWEENSVLKGRADIVAFYWGHMEHKKKNLTMYLIEVKQGHKAIKTNKPNTKKESPGLLKHYHDYEAFLKDSATVEFTKSDMLEVLRQKTELGLIIGLSQLFKKDKNGKLSTKGITIEDNVEFVFLLANYLHFSNQLKNELNLLPTACRFFCSSFMGYGLYEKYIVNKSTTIHYPEIFVTE